MSKYPGADTSKERLTEVVGFYDGKPFDVTTWRKKNPEANVLLIYDLLAMIEERDAALRWRVTAEEMPPEDTKVLVNENGNLSEEWQFEFAKWNKQYDDSIRWVETREFMHMDQPKLWRPL